MELRELRTTKLTRLLNEGPVTGRDAPKLSYLTQKILHRVVWPGEIQRRPAAITASRIRVYSAFGGISFFNVSASATVCASASVTLAVVVCVSTDAVTLECQAQSAEAADTDRPNTAANTSNVFIVVLLLR